MEEQKKRKEWLVGSRATIKEQEERKRIDAAFALIYMRVWIKAEEEEFMCVKSTKNAHKKKEVRAIY